MSATELYERLVALEGLDGSHVSVDRDMHGEESVNVSPDWIEGAALAEVLALAREAEVEVALTKSGLRLASHTSPTSLGVKRVKDVLTGAEDADE
jgi:hypothetical protein